MLELPWNHPNPVVRAISTRQDDSANDAGACLPTDLLAATPECSKSCILEFVQLNYQDNKCPFTSSLTYLCTSRTSSGLTIGEGAIQCLASRCVGDDLREIDAYYICDNVPGAIPKTMSVITATIQPTTNSMEVTLPSVIGNPTSTQDVTSIVMASGVPSMGPRAPTTPAMTAATTTSSSSTELSSTASSSTPTSTGSSVAVSERVTSTSGLSSAAIAGISVGAALVATLILAFVFWRCRRRRKAERPRSQRWSLHGGRTPPPNFEPPPDLPVMTKAPDNGSLSPLESNQRFYAPVVPGDKRRSFWRRSIKPEEIGVAVSPYAHEPGSPTSLSSQQSMSKLLPKMPKVLPTRASRSLWPAPLDLDTIRPRQSFALRPSSVSTVFDEDIEANTSTIQSKVAAGRYSLGGLRPSTARRDNVPTPLQLNPVTQEDIRPASRTNNQSPPGDRMPLTPTYDNGNIVENMSREYPPSSWRPVERMDELSTAPPLSALPEDTSPTRKMQPAKNVLHKKATAAAIGKAQVSRADAATATSEWKPAPIRKDSDTTAGTEIEEDTTPPEEVEKRLETPPKIKPGAISTLMPVPGTEAPRSPISNLKYPAVPRSVAVSRQAEVPSRLAPSVVIPSTTGTGIPPRLRRDQLVRNESSFMVTDTTSSDGYLSDRSIEWPQPPPRSSQLPLKEGITRLRENPGGANRGFGPPPSQRSMDQMMLYGPRTSSLMSPIGNRAKLTPNTNSKGDLFFTVEM